MRRVIKVGGSLLSSPNLPDSLTRWIERQGVAENLVVVGGGELVDAIRKLDQIRPSDPVKTHWRCIELMEMTRSIFADWFDWDSIITSRQLETVMANEFSSERPTVVAVKAFYDAATKSTVPMDWCTTSDTIAAILALTVEADELVLLKRCELDPRQSIAGLAASGIVDQAIQHLADQVPSIRVEQLK